MAQVLVEWFLKVSKVDANKRHAKGKGGERGLMPLGDDASTACCRLLIALSNAFSKMIDDRNFKLPMMHKLCAFMHTFR